MSFSLVDEDEEQMRYFDGTDGVVAVFPFDYEKIMDYQWEVTNNTFLAGFPFCILGLPCQLLCAKQNLEDAIRCQHVCVTRDGIRYVRDKHKTGCRFDCQDEGKVTKTVPFDKLTDCDIEEPAGAEGPICCMVQRVLHTVNVDTASSGGGGHELTIVGLQDPHAFKETVWNMKRAGGAHLAPAQQAMSGAGAPGGAELAALLTRNNELLQQQVSLLQQIAANTSK